MSDNEGIDNKGENKKDNRYERLAIILALGDFFLALGSFILALISFCFPDSNVIFKVGLFLSLILFFIFLISLILLLLYFVEDTKKFLINKWREHKSKVGVGIAIVAGIFLIVLIFTHFPLGHDSSSNNSNNITKNDSNGENINLPESQDNTGKDSTGGSDSGGGTGSGGGKDSDGGGDG